MSVDRLRQLEQAATPGPWKADCVEDPNEPTGDGDEQYVFRPEVGHQVCAYYDSDSADAELIAAMRNALPALLDVAEAAERAQSLLGWSAREDVERDLCAALDRLREVTS